jgi:DNA-binding MarR family transcriptional regulator
VPIISHLADEAECEKETKRLEKNQLAVLKLLNESEKKLSVRTMADKLMLPKSGVDRIIQQLKKEKLIDESGMPTAGGLTFLKE